jgi:hypothetical protein
MERALGRLLLFAGVILAVAGATLLLFPRLRWLGRLPGDLRLSRDGISIFVPLASCLLLSLLLTLLLNLVHRR